MHDLVPITVHDPATRLPNRPGNRVPEQPGGIWPSADDFSSMGMQRASFGVLSTG